MFSIQSNWSRLGLDEKNITGLQYPALHSRRIKWKPVRVAKKNELEWIINFSIGTQCLDMVCFDMKYKKPCWYYWRSVRWTGPLRSWPIIIWPNHIFIAKNAKYIPRELFLFLVLTPSSPCWPLGSLIWSRFGGFTLTTKSSLEKIKKQGGTLNCWTVTKNNCTRHYEYSQYSD